MLVQMNIKRQPVIQRTQRKILLPQFKNRREQDVCNFIFYYFGYWFIASPFTYQYIQEVV